MANTFSYVIGGGSMNDGNASEVEELAKETRFSRHYGNARSGSGKAYRRG